MPEHELSDVLARIVADDDAGGNSRARQKALADFAVLLSRRARKAGIRAVAAGRWMVDEIIELAPRVTVRDATTLHRQFPELSSDQIAERLTASATRASTALGAAGGGLAAVQFAAPPLLLATPVQLAAETLAITAIELKLVAELHEIYGRPAAGTPTERAGAYLMSWVRKRAIAPAAAGAGLGTIMGAAAKRELRGQVLRRFGQSTTTLAPFMAGAVAGAEINRRTTRKLGETLAAELRELAEQRPDDEKWFRRL
jgi:hypothetical protein